MPLQDHFATRELYGLLDEIVPPKFLRERSIAALAEYIKDGKAKKIVVMVSQC
jgi:hypothetical protein